MLHSVRVGVAGCNQPFLAWGCAWVQQPPGGETKLNSESGPDNLTVRVLKPPGGGSSIVFGEDDEVALTPKTKSVSQQEASPLEKQEPSPKPETNGTATPQCEKVDAVAAVKENNPEPATTNGSATINGSATTNGTATTNGSSSSRSSTASTPTSAKQLDTQSRLFGHEPVQCTPSRRIRDHHRSNIFTTDDPDAKANGTTNDTPRAVFCRKWTRRDPVTGVGVLCWDIHAPRFAPNKRKAGTPIPSENHEVKTPEPQPQQKQRQRVPPGGFSTQLW
ncbi:uncharacterized protein [Panulirus ornatus]|uniref:uncharacterized protein isoform X3 n=1 Tax=Panulirus ornatus TaxID=150431 RepID=UPI003A883D1F